MGIKIVYACPQCGHTGPIDHGNFQIIKTKPKSLHEMIIEAYGRRCARCGITKDELAKLPGRQGRPAGTRNLFIHHTNGDGDQWREMLGGEGELRRILAEHPGDVELLCPACHHNVHCPDNPSPGYLRSGRSAPIRW